MGEKKKMREWETFISSALHRGVFTVCAVCFIGSQIISFTDAVFFAHCVHHPKRDARVSLTPHPSLVALSPVSQEVSYREMQRWTVTPLCLMRKSESLSLSPYCCFTFRQPLWSFTCAKTITLGSQWVCVCVRVYTVYSHIWDPIRAFSVSLSLHLARSLNVPHKHTYSYTLPDSLPVSLSSFSFFFFFLRASRSPCPWLYDREKCVYKTRSLADQTVRTNQRLWREERERERQRRRSQGKKCVKETQHRVVHGEASSF